MTWQLQARPNNPLTTRQVFFLRRRNVEVGLGVFCRRPDRRNLRICRNRGSGGRSCKDSLLYFHDSFSRVASWPFESTGMTFANDEAVVFSGSSFASGFLNVRKENLQ